MELPSNRYAQSGVNTDLAQNALEGLLSWVQGTLTLRQGIGKPLMGIGHFANVVSIDDTTGVAISTDGVGSKVLVAQLANSYQGIGYDCIAVNVNDVLCVGAEPLTVVDCLSVQRVQPEMLEQIGKGLYEGALRANINIVGGELAQLPEIIQGPRDGYGFDVVGTCIGSVKIDRVIDGKDLAAGDVVVGLSSSGLHSNGFTLVREILSEEYGYQLDAFVPELGKTLGDELLTPTHIYVPEILGLLASGISVKALAHISGDGLLNLARVAADVGFVVDQLPRPLPIFEFIQKTLNLPLDQMYEVFNMGIGFCVVVSSGDAQQVIDIVGQNGSSAQVIGHVVADPERRVWLQEQRLVGAYGKFRFDA
jgi:phosphoribosylformylglycinamidine cyclo-ligase